MKAIILAAGKGTRLGKLTLDKPKGMLDFMGKTLLEHQIAIYRLAGFTDITIIRGYKKNKIDYKDIKYIDNDLYDETNMIESLICARDQINDDCIISYSDILFSANLLASLVQNKSSVVITVDSDWKKYWEQRYGCLTEDLEDLQIKNNKVIKIGQPVTESKSLDYRYVGLNKFTLEGMRQMLSFYDKKKLLKEQWKSSGNQFKNGYMTDILQEMIDDNVEVTPHFTKNEWLEIDTESDYIVAKELYLNKEFKF
tara:strand:+ start:264 stop:1025 length:762 start_codon:yes stop_codon:yes gene_type:complete